MPGQKSCHRHAGQQAQRETSAPHRPLGVPEGLIGETPGADPSNEGDSARREKPVGSHHLALVFMGRAVLLDHLDTDLVARIGQQIDPLEVIGALADGRAVGLHHGLFREESIASIEANDGAQRRVAGEVQLRPESVAASGV